MLRDRKLLDLAHDIHECQLRIPGVCRGYEPDGCAPCHGNWSWIGIGMSIKAHDVFAAGCSSCHYALDNYVNLSRQEAEEYWCKGAIRTWMLLMRDGKLVRA